MAYNFDIAPLNPLRFYQIADELIDFSAANQNFNLFNPNYNYRLFDEDFYLRNVPVWEEARFFAQPFQQGDFVRCQFLGIPDVEVGPSTFQNPYIVFLIDCNGKIYSSNSVTSPSATLIDGQKIREFEIPLYNVAEGYYRVVILRDSIVGFLPNKEAVISEPIHVKQTHPYSVLINYTNTKNAQGVIFQYGLNFQFRAYAVVKDLETLSKINTFEDEPLNLTTLSSTPYRQWTLHVGGQTNQVPDWFVDKIERITGCDTMTIDGKQYTRAEGAKLEINKPQGASLSSCKVTLRESINDNNLYVEEYQYVYKMGTAYDTKYFYIRDISYGSGPTTRQVRKIFSSQRQFLDYLNSVFKDAYSLGGTFGITPDGEYGYKPSSSTDATTFSNITITQILPYGIKYDVSCVGTQNSLILDYLSGGSGSYAVEWGDGTSAYNTYTGNFTLTKNYTTNKTYSAIICVNDIEGIDANTAEDIIVSIGGDLAPSVINLTLQNNILKYINSSLFDYVTNGTFVTLELDGNRLLTSSVDTIIKTMYENADKISGLSAALNNQTPSASPSQEIVQKLLPTLVANNNSFNFD